MRLLSKKKPNTNFRSFEDIENQISLPVTSKKEIERSKEQDLLDEYKLSLQVAERLKRSTEELELFEQESEEKKGKIKKDFQAVFDESLSRRNALEKEISDLEERRLKALEPLTEIQHTLTCKEDELKKREDELLSLASSIQNEKNKLNDKYVEIEHSFEEIKLLDESLVQRDSNIKKEEAELVKRKDELQVLYFQELALKSQLETITETERRWRETEKLANQSKEESLRLREQKLATEKKHLESQQQSLKLAFEEARRKNII